MKRAQRQAKAEKKTLARKVLVESQASDLVAQAEELDEAPKETEEPRSVNCINF